MKNFWRTLIGKINDLGILIFQKWKIPTQLRIIFALFWFWCDLRNFTFSHSRNLFHFLIHLYFNFLFIIICARLQKRPSSDLCSRRLSKEKLKIKINDFLFYLVFEWEEPSIVRLISYMKIMAIRVVKLTSGGYRIRKIFA